jgi:hypothetical protein
MSPLSSSIEAADGGEWRRQFIQNDTTTIRHRAIWSQRNIRPTGDPESLGRGVS